MIFLKTRINQAKNMIKGEIKSALLIFKKGGNHYERI